MKKFVLILVLTLCCFTLAGCKKDELSKISEDLSNYYLDVTLNEDMTLSCVERLDYINESDVVLDSLSMHLYPNAFREGSKYPPVSLSSSAKAYPNGKSYGRIDIINVSLKDKQIEFEIGGIDENILSFKFDKDLYPGDRQEIEIAFNVTLPNVNHRFGYGNNTVNIANFFPIACVWENGGYKTDVYSSNGDPFFSNVANFEVDFKCPEKYKVASSGEINEEKCDGGIKSINLTSKVMRDFAIVCSEKFEIKEKDVDGTKLLYYYYNDENPEQSLQTCEKSLKTFEEMIGDYPYPTMSVVEANFVHGGMEYPGLIYISDSLSSYEEYTNVIVHEMAHQWWYGMVGNNEYSSSWLDEGLTEYSTALFYEKNPEYNKTVKDIAKNNWKSYALFISIYENVLGEVDTSMDRELNQYGSETEYVYVSYVKGMLLFDSVREVIGQEKFEKAMKLYFEENKYKVATSETLISCFEKASGCDLENLFNAWICGEIVIVDQL